MFGKPGATGPHQGNPILTLCITHRRIQGALHGVLLPPDLPGDGKAPWQDSLPLPAKGVGDDHAATRLFSWDTQGTQWHRCHMYIYIYMAVSD